MNEVALEQRQIASIESELSDLMTEGVEDVNPKVVQSVADGLALKDEGKKFSDLSPNKQKSIYGEALTAEQERLKEKHRREVTSRQRQLAALRGEDIPEEEEQKEESPKFIDPISKEAVEAARARGQTDAQIRRSLQALGASNEKIVSLL
jgi:hypothetical protein